MNGLELHNDFSGANPRSPDRVRKNPDGSVTVLPDYEPETPPGYRFRLDVDLKNRGADVDEALLRVLWDDARYMGLRRRIFIRRKGGEGFSPVAAAPGGDGTEVLFRFPVPPGTTEVALLPRYGRDDLQALVSFCRGFSGFSLQEFSMEHGPLGVLCFRSGGPRPAILVFGRIHPYETAGSFCADAIARAVCSDALFRQSVLSRFDLLVIPVMTPAGVHLGFCRRNGAPGGGIDLARQWEHKDPVCRAVAELADRQPIAGVLDVHNWMHQETDGIKFVNRWTAARFRAGLEGAAGKGRRFSGIFRRGLFAHRPGGVAGYLQGRGAFCLMTEYPWAGRDENEMAELGRRSLLSFCRLLKG
ncbi:MAG: hypothetical protein AB1921_15435 [Thermodesulfobacteriota bacterium]